ncbi:MAG: hypothetical protein QOI48_3031 [Solirubrobacteraceae bacterium]|nr:hypothetical protein [Solirubrobacteraceae bacterium]
MARRSRRPSSNPARVVARVRFLVVVVRLSSAQWRSSSTSAMFGSRSHASEAATPPPPVIGCAAHAEPSVARSRQRNTCGNRSRSLRRSRLAATVSRFLPVPGTVPRGGSRWVSTPDASATAIRLSPLGPARLIRRRSGGTGWTHHRLGGSPDHHRPTMHSIAGPGGWRSGWMAESPRHQASARPPLQRAPSSTRPDRGSRLLPGSRDIALRNPAIHHHIVRAASIACSVAGTSIRPG